MHSANYVYHHNEQALYGYLAYSEENSKRPAVLVVHDWSGRNDFACQKAEALASMGYVGFAIDMYGQARVGETIDEKKALMEPLINNRQRLVERMQTALETIKAIEHVDSHRIAVIGFCFGGLCALDLARSGANFTGAVSFHGLLNAPSDSLVQKINAKLLVLHGYDDPMVPPEQVFDFCQEMTKAEADWQLQMYGHTKHAFTNPQAHDQSLGTIYNERSAHRAWQSMEQFLTEIFA